MGFSVLKYYCAFVQYSLFHGYNKVRIWRIGATFFGIIGILWTLVECFTWIFDNSTPSLPDALREFIRGHLRAIGVIILLISCYLNRLKIKISQTFTNTDLTLIVEYCDLLDQEGAVVVPISDTFDSNTSNGLVNPKTIHGQFIGKYYPNNIQSLDNEISRVLQSNGVNPIANEPNLIGKKDRYEIGTTCLITTNNKHFYLTALTYMRETGNVDIQPQYISQFLMALYDYIPRFGIACDEVNIPVIGTGLHRLPASYTKEYIVREIANSFFLISKQQSFCKTLRICLNIYDYKHYDFDDLKMVFTHIDKYLNR